MPTQHSRVKARLMISPAVLLLLGWMLIPLGLTVYFSLLRYNLLMPGMEQWTGLTNYRFFLTDPAFFDALGTRWCSSSAFWRSPSSAACCWRCCSINPSGDGGSCASW